MPKNRFLCTTFSHPQDRQSGDYLHRVVWPGKEVQQTISTLASKSDAVQFSSLFLEQEYSRYGMITHARGAGLRPA